MADRGALIGLLVFAIIFGAFFGFVLSFGSLLMTVVGVAILVLLSLVYYFVIGADVEVEGESHAAH